MTATYRHDTSFEAGEIMEKFCPSFKVFGPRDVTRWAGVGNGYTPRVTFAVKLPLQFTECCNLIAETAAVITPRYVKTVEVNFNFTKTAFKSMTLLIDKMCVGLGLGKPLFPDYEQPSIDSIMEGDFNSWLVYADWLEERGNIRGKLIRAINGKKAIPVKYGLPDFKKLEEWP